MAEESLIDNSLDFSKLKVPDLKKELKLRGLSTGGNKNELLDRLQKVLRSSDTIGNESVDDLDEDILEDDDDDHIDANDGEIFDNDLDESPKGQKRKLDDNVEEADTKKPITKKVVLNRNPTICTEMVKSSTEQHPENQPEKVEENKSYEEKKIIKLSQINAKERLELRAKKFGITALSTDAKRAVRAERFGSGSSNSANSITSAKVDTSADVLKQRAQRFGSSVSTAVLSSDNQEKLEKRKARFGVTSTTNGTSEDKAKARLERFKEPIV